MASRKVYHAHDHLTNYNQKRVTTICGKRVTHFMSTYADAKLHVSCVGCLAILAERAKENGVKA